MDVRVTEFAVAEAKARFSELLGRAEAGEEITIKRHGRAVARLAPVVAPQRTVEERLKGWDNWFAYRDAHDIALGPDMTIMDLLADTRGE